MESDIRCWLLRASSLGFGPQCPVVASVMAVCWEGRATSLTQLRHMILAGPEPAIFGSEGQRLIHQAVLWSVCAELWSVCAVLRSVCAVLCCRLSGLCCAVVCAVQWSALCSGLCCAVVCAVRWSVLRDGLCCAMVCAAQWSVLCCAVQWSVQWSVLCCAVLCCAAGAAAGTGRTSISAQC